MNKKGFTLVELLVTIAVASLVLSLGAITVNNIIDNSKDKSVTIAHENIKKSANLYSKEFNNEIAWINNQSCISLEQLISKGYLRKEEVKDATHDYIIIKKDDNSTIISETTSDGVNNICNAIIKKTVTPPTSKDICNNLEYNGNTQYLIKENIGDVYKITNDSIKEGKNAGSYPVTIELQDGYHWKGNSADTKTVYCAIEKGIPELLLKDLNGNETYGQEAEKTIPVEITITSNIGGIIELKSSNDKYVSVELAETNASKDFSLESKNGQYEKKIIIKNNANRDTNTYITIKLIPNNPNYQITTKTYIIGKITDIKRDKPTTTASCTNPYYNSIEQTITEAAKIGYTFYNNQQTNVGKYTVTAQLHPGFEWEDGSKNDITFECEIRNLTYKVAYNGNNNTGGSMTTSSHIYGETKNLTENSFTKTGYTFAGWSTTVEGNVVYADKQSVINLINPKTDTNGTTITLYAKWNPKTYTINYEGNGGNSTTYGSSWSETATYDANYKTHGNLYTRTGYKFIGWNEKADGSGVDWTTWINKDWKWTYDKDVTLYAQWRPNKVYIQYSTNGGNITPSTTENGIQYTWTTNSNGIISRSKSGEAATPNFYAYNYNSKISESGLVNWNNSTYINITKTGYGAKSDAQWICLSGDCIQGTTYNHTDQYDASAFCNASNGDCTAVLGVNWVDNIAPTCTVSYTQTDWTSSGVDVTITCSDSGSGCATAKQYGYDLKANKTYTVKDNAGNSGTCTASIQNRTIYRTRTSSTKWEARCLYSEIGAPEVSSVWDSMDGLETKADCVRFCQKIQLTTGYLTPKCTSYTAYSDWGVWKTTSCTPSTTCESLKQYKKK